MEIVKENIERLRLYISNTAVKKKAYTKFYGCAQNEADMETIRGMLEQMGYEFTDATKFYYNDDELPAWHDTYESNYDWWADECVDILLYFRDIRPNSKNLAVENELLRACDVNNIPVATNIATAETIILALERGDLDWREYVKGK